MPKILFLAAHRPDRSPSQRYRFEQYFSFLEQNGFHCHLSFLISEKDDKVFYSKGKILRKFFILAQSFFKRLKDCKKYKHYEIVFVQREALMIGSTFFERKISKSKAKFVFDFDDSIWLLDTSEGNKRFEWLKNPLKTSIIIKHADLVFAGNTYLANYAKQFNPNVKVIPTTIDTTIHFPQHDKRNKNTLCIGWSGSITTIKHFVSALPYLKLLKAKYGERIAFKVMGDESYTNEELSIQGVKWVSSKEVEILNSFDIGIMPLPDDEWAKGKCGLKGLSYMALEIPTVMSPVGVNNEIIQHGINGFLAKDQDEWVNFLSLLIESAELRGKLGAEARKTVINKYSVDALKHNYLNEFNALLSG